MATSKHIDKICCIIMTATLLLTFLFINAGRFGVQAVSAAAGYASRLFNTAEVHTIDIIMDDWDSFIETCTDEQYTDCAVVIDGESFRNVAIRAKGNTSLSSVAAYGNDRYSFKIEFDHYDNAMNYYGLDKLCLNNIIQDNTYMKDYLTYRLMHEFGVDSPLCSYVYITVNGQDWGLYLAVEGVEESFLTRNYGNEYGELYKPDSMKMGGGRGNGQGFDFGNFYRPESSPDMQNPPAMPNLPDMPEGGSFLKGMGSSDVSLIYTDDEFDSYANIFDNAKTSPSDADKTRLIETLKNLNETENKSLETTVAIDEVIRYFVVHNFVLNFDSYTGAMIHNYYLYEKDGQLSMIPWDYNLAFGTFQGADTTQMVNSPIDTPVSTMDAEDARPMVDWIFKDGAFTGLYHEYFTEFLERTDFDALIGETAELIAPYVEKDPTKFYMYEEFGTGVEALREFCALRAQSVAGQIAGRIPATDSAQEQEKDKLVDASHLTLSDMGTMDGGMKGGPFAGEGRREESGTGSGPGYRSGEAIPRRKDFP